MTESDFQPLIAWLELNPNWIYLSVGFIAFVESLALAGVIVPGVLLLFLVCALAGHLSLSIEWLLLSGFIGAVLGDGISFFLGHYFKDNLRGIWPFSSYPKTLQAGEEFFHKHGGKSVMIGRFIGPIRPVIPIVAGMLGMSQTRFTIFNAASAVIWAPFYILPGYLTGSAIQLALPANFYPALLSLIGALIAIAIGFSYASVSLQQNARFYDLLVNKNSKYKTETEFPLASISLFVGATLFFVIWSYLVLQTNLLVPIDTAVSQLSASLREMSPFIDTMVTHTFVHLTLLGDEKFLYISFVILIALMLYLRQYRASVLLIVSGLSTAAVTHALKAFFSVARPELVLSPPSSYAYPSGHSSGAVVFYGLIAAFVAQNIAFNQRWKCYLLFFIPMFLIAFSRVMLSVHWLSDVVGGITLGLAICGFSRLVYSSHHPYDAARRRDTPEEKRAMILTFCIWSLAAIIYQLVVLRSAIENYQLNI